MNFAFSRTMLKATPLLFALVLAEDSYGQQRTTSAWEARSSTLSGGLEFGIPLGEFDFTWGKGTAGLSANISIPLRTLPFEVGYDFGWGRMGGEYSLEQGTGNIFSGPTGRKVEVNSNVYGHHGLIRFNPLRGKIRPYGDALLGARHFVTRSVATSAGGATSEERDGSITPSYGWALGLMVGFGRSFYVEGRVERLLSGQVSYVDPNSIAIASDGSVTYDKLRSRTDAVMIQLGVGLRF